MPRTLRPLAAALALAALPACSESDPDAGPDVTGTYDGTIDSRYVRADVRLVVRESPAGTLTGSLALDTSGNAVPYRVSGQRDGDALPMTFTSDTGVRIDYDAAVSEAADGTLRIAGDVCSVALEINCSSLVLSPAE